MNGASSSRAACAAFNSSAVSLASLTSPRRSRSISRGRLALLGGGVLGSVAAGGAGSGGGAVTSGEGAGSGSCGLGRFSRISLATAASVRVPSSMTFSSSSSERPLSFFLAAARPCLRAALSASMRARPRFASSLRAASTSAAVAVSEALIFTTSVVVSSSISFGRKSVSNSSSASSSGAGFAFLGEAAAGGATSPGSGLGGSPGGFLGCCTFGGFSPIHRMSWRLSRLYVASPTRTTRPVPSSSYVPPGTSPRRDAFPFVPSSRRSSAIRCWDGVFRRASRRAFFETFASRRTSSIAFPTRRTCSPTRSISEASGAFGPIFARISRGRAA